MTTSTVTQAEQKFNQLTSQLKAAVSEYEQARDLHIKVTVRWEAAKSQMDEASHAVANGIAEFIDVKKE